MISLVPKQKIRPSLLKLQDNIEKIIKGKSEIVQCSIICLLARGHLLLEDAPGVGKTTLAHCIANSLALSFSRIQFTSDMLPSDILGVTVFDQNMREFEFKQGPIFANVVLADEINRTTPKTQSALLEAMNSAQVSTEKGIQSLPRPFVVLATQNPIEFHGTFPLPKSQMDRFMMRLHIGYPSVEDEVEVLRDQNGFMSLNDIQSVFSVDEIIKYQDEVDKVKIDDSLLKYIAQVVSATRTNPNVLLGISTRGAIALRRAAQARAYFESRDYCIPDDIKEMLIPVFAHRILLHETSEVSRFRHEKEHQILKIITDQIEIPL